MSVSALAIAGKEERDLYTKDVAPAVSAAQSAWKSSCGCPLAVKIDDSIMNSRYQLNQVKNLSDSISEEAPKYCTDAASKKAMCQMSTLAIVPAKAGAFTFKGGHGTATITNDEVPSFPMITAVLDK
jgi:hypothetical protein|nr:hypothetical protein [Kofleriaceae bacterium]